MINWCYVRLSEKQILEVFIQNFLPPEASNAVKNIFAKIDDDLPSVLAGGINVATEALQKGDQSVKTSYASGILLGVVLCHAIKNKDARKEVFEDYIELTRRSQGENVLDINQYRRG